MLKSERHNGVRLEQLCEPAPLSGRQLLNISHQLIAVSLLLIRWCFGQRWRQQPFLFFFLIIECETGRRDHTRGYENNQVLLVVLLRITAKRPADKWNVP